MATREERILELPRKNADSVMAALTSMTLKMEDQQIRIDGLNAFVSTLSNRLNALEQSLALEKAKAMGHGPTG
jgi:hypothetical protein